jgi:hypothetical protein
MSIFGWFIWTQNVDSKPIFSKVTCLIKFWLMLNAVSKGDSSGFSF